MSDPLLQIVPIDSPPFSDVPLTLPTTPAESPAVEAPSLTEFQPSPPVVPLLFGAAFGFVAALLIGIGWLVMRPSEDNASATDQTALATASATDMSRTRAGSGDWEEIIEVGRRSNNWLAVNIKPDTSGRRVAQFQVDADTEKVQPRTLADGEGVPLLEYKPLTLKLIGWSETATKPQNVSLVKANRETEMFRIQVLNDYGTGNFDRSDDTQQSFDHRHLWSPQGDFVYVLTGTPRGRRPCKIQKINTHTWETELELKVHSEVTDIAWSSAGLIAVTHLGPTRWSPAKEGWVQFVPSNRLLEETKGGIFVLDPGTLAVRRGWISPHVDQATGNPSSDLVYLSSAESEILQVVNVQTGELLSCYTKGDFVGKDANDKNRRELHFGHPRLTADGKSLVTHGFSIGAMKIQEKSVWSTAPGPRSVHQFQVSGATIEWKQSRRVGGITSRFTRVADVGMGTDFVCLPEQQFEITPINDFHASLAKLTLPPEAAVVVDSPTKTIYLCWPDWGMQQLRLRVIRGAFDTDLVLAEDIQPNTTRVQFSSTKYRREFEVHRNLLPFEMSSAPGGRGVLVFTPKEAYWIEPQFTSSSDWAFRISPQNRTAEAEKIATDASSQYDTPLRHAAMLTRCKAATALVYVPASGRSGTAFCVDTRGYFLTTAHHVAGLKSDAVISLAVNGGSIHERILAAKVVRSDKDLDVALLKADPFPGLVALPFGRDDLLTEAAKLISFGYPKVAKKDFEEERIPTVAAQAGTANAVRRADDETKVIQFDGKLVPGNDGGPVVDEQGTVQGIIHSAIVPLGLDFVIPVTQIAKLGWPELNLGRVNTTDTAEASRKLRELALAAKKGTAFVFLPSQGVMGSAFCVDSRGYFATNAHVVDKLRDEALIVLNSGEPEQMVLPARLMRKGKRVDLALLELIDPQDGLTALELADNGQVHENMQVAALGFPYGTILSVSEDFPSVSINVGSVTATDVTALGQKSFEFRSQLNPGNSGGPVIGPDGKVVGVVFATTLGGGKSNAIPVDRLRQFMYEPGLEFTQFYMRHSARYEPVPFKLKLTPYLKSLEGMEVELTLKPQFGPAAVHAVPPSNKPGIYETRVPLIAPDVPDYLTATFDFRGGSVNGLVADRSFQAGNTDYRLTTVPAQTLPADQSLKGLEDLVVETSAGPVTIDASRAVSMSLVNLPSSHVSCTFVVRLDGEKLAELTEQIRINDIPNRQARNVLNVKRFREIWSEGFFESESESESGTPPLKVTATYERGIVTGLAQDCEFSFGGRSGIQTFSLREVTRMQRTVRVPGRYSPIPGSSPYNYEFTLIGQGNVRSRAVTSNRVDGLDKVTLQLDDGNNVVLDLTQANKLQVEAVREPGTQEFPLRTKITDVVPAAAGNCLVLHLLDLGIAALFDVGTCKITHDFALPDEKVLLAAGAEKLVIAVPATKKIQRWDLKTGRMEAEETLPSDFVPGAMAMGCGGNGPLLIHGFDSAKPNAPRWILVDLESLKMTTLDAPSPRCRFPVSPTLTASVDGSVFGSVGMALFVSGTTANVVKIEGRTAVVQASPDGQRLFHHTSVYSRDGQRIESEDVGELLPACRADNCDYLLALGASRESGAVNPLRVAICSFENDKATQLIAYPMVRFESVPVNSETVRKRYHLNIESKVLITFPPPGDRIILYKLPEWER